MLGCFPALERLSHCQLPMAVSTQPLTYHCLLPLHSVSYQGVAYATWTWDFGLLGSDSPPLSQGNFKDFLPLMILYHRCGSFGLSRGILKHLTGEGKRNGWTRLVPCSLGCPAPSTAIIRSNIWRCKKNHILSDVEWVSWMVLANNASMHANHSQGTPRNDDSIYFYNALSWL